MSFPLPPGAKDAGDGKGLGLFASRYYEPGSILFEDEALFKGVDGVSPEDECQHFYTKLMHWYDCLLEESSDRQMLEYVLFKRPSPHMLSVMGLTRSQLEIHNPEFAELDEETKVRNLYAILNFYGGAHLMHDVNDRHTGFSVHGSLLNHSCIPSAILSTYDCTTEQSHMVGWKTGRIQIRALTPIKAGEEITISYDQHLRGDPQARRQYLRKVYEFDCTCHACKHENPSSRAQFISLHDISQTILAKNISCPHAYRAMHRFCGIAISAAWNDRPVLRIFQYAAYLAEKHNDRLREKYFASQALQWCSKFFGEEHQSTAWLRRRVDYLGSLGLPSIIGEDGPDVRPLVFMSEHPNDDNSYYFLRYDEGVLSEFVANQNDRVSDLAAEAARVEASRASLLKEVEAEAEKTAAQQARKKEKKAKAKARKKQASQAAETSSDDEDPSGAAPSQSSPEEQPTSISTSTNVPKDTMAVDREETITSLYVSEDLTSSDSQGTDPEQQSNTSSGNAKGKQRAAEYTPERAPRTYPLTSPDSTEERSTSASPSRQTQSASPPTPASPITPPSEPRESQTPRTNPVKFSLRNPPTLPALPMTPGPLWHARVQAMLKSSRRPPVSD